MASSVVGGKQMNGMADGRIVTRNAIDEILKYYHLKPTDIPPSVKELDDQLDGKQEDHEDGGPVGSLRTFVCLQG